MFDFIIQKLFEKSCEKKQRQILQSNIITSPKENVVVDIDYDKLAKAIIDANEKFQERQKQKERIEQERQHANWLKLLSRKKHIDENESFSLNSWQIFWGLMLFKKENATTDNATYALLRICNGFFLFVYQWIFYILAGVFFACGLYFLVSPLFTHLFSFVTVLYGFMYIIVTISLTIVAQIIRVVKLESASSQEKETVTMVFNSIVSFTAMVFAIIAVLVAPKCGGV